MCPLFGPNTSLLSNSYPVKRVQQIVEVINCGLTMIGVLSFDLKDGACTVANNEIYLCFSNHDQSATKLCRKFTDPLGTATNINDTTFGHSKAHIAASTGKASRKSFISFDSLGLLLTAGGHFTDSDKHAETEVYDLTQGQWTTGGDLPEISWLHTIAKDRKSKMLSSSNLLSILKKSTTNFST